MAYDPKKIEPKWQKKWREERIYEPDLDKAKRPFYNLMMFPYPSAEGLHVGNMYAFTGSDIYGRMKRMQGEDVFEPIGLDGFGIHSENYALKIGAHPMDQAAVSEKRFYGQLEKIGNGFAWEERLETYDPEYYRWTQWIFAEMFRRGLAYRKKQSVNWCPKDQTVLADEQVEGGKCERCGTEVVKKDLEQWFFRITQYADRLLVNIPKLDWSEKVKIAQTNWIGKSEGAKIAFRIQHSESSIRVFTTRPDTLFGATYLVLAPEHPLMQHSEFRIQNLVEVKEYIAGAKMKKEEERLAEGKEKTGVELKGVKAVNPANGEELPIWVADYVLGSYGTGAIMAVPAHDKRDFEFAKKFNLPIREVVAQETGVPHENEERRDGGCGVVFDPKTQKYAVAKHPDGLVRLFAGGVDGNEDIEAGVLREITEESGLHHFGYIEKVRSCFTHYYNRRKKVFRSALATCFLVVLKDKDVQPQKLEPHEQGFELIWMTPQEIISNWDIHNENHDVDHWFIFLREAVARAIELGYDKTNKENDFRAELFTGGGILVNSGKFDGRSSETAKWEIVKFVGGEKKTQFRLRDWSIGRQRYWGPPIPMIFCDVCAKAGKGGQKEMPGWYAVQNKDLPVVLPRIKDFRPTGSGVSPLAAEKSFYEAACPQCGSKARRETDIIDNFVDSAWYYLGYLGIGYRESGLGREEPPFSEERVKKWLPVDMYIGGAEHSVLHLLYVRFIAMALHDWGIVPFEEPIKKFRAHGLIIKDGAKMSKSKGNVINPDEYIANFGADTLRMYLMFLAPFEQGGDFRDQGILGTERFLKEVWAYFEKRSDQYATEISKKASTKTNIKRDLHKTIKKVGSDIEQLKYNTAISALMIFRNRLAAHMSQVVYLDDDDAGIFLKLIAPFAPHITEEIWRETLGHKNSIHREPWPVYDPELIKDETVNIVFQVNGKIRDMMSMDAGVTEDEAKAAALASLKIKAILGAQTPKRIIYVDKKLVNIVI